MSGRYRDISLSISIYLYLYLYLSIYIYIYREREREREIENGIWLISSSSEFLVGLSSIVMLCCDHADRHKSFLGFVTESVYSKLISLTWSAIIIW